MNTFQLVGDLHAVNMSRKSLTNEKIRQILAATSCADSEGELFDSDEEYGPPQNIQLSDSDEESFEEEIIRTPSNISSNDSTPTNIEKGCSNEG